MAQQSLYRRYRPRRFAELRGQDHISRALQHAIASGTEGQAYLFSGPRGTGKTSTARILAKALNCTALAEGEPCGTCDSCVSMDGGTSYDLFELDAASNNGVDAIRELISRTTVSSPGRTKVYILDEVHMLSTAASNALLKTLEEPPDHVVFVLATTDPQKVLPTIRSRTQHYEFSLIGADELADYVRWVIADAGLDLEDSVVPEVVRLGRGSARDTLSALDRVAALGGLDGVVTPIDDLLAGLADAVAASVIGAVAAAVGVGVEPRTLAESVLVALRDAFLVAVHVDTPHLSADDRDRAAALGARFGTARVTRAMESIGSALVDMRQASDPRVPLEVALLRLCAAVTGSPGASPSSADGTSGTPADSDRGAPGVELVELRRRIEALETSMADGPPQTGPASGDDSLRAARQERSRTVAASDAAQGDAGHGDAGQGDAGQGDAGHGDAGHGDAGHGDAGSAANSTAAGSARESLAQHRASRGPASAPPRPTSSVRGSAGGPAALPREAAPPAPGRSAGPPPAAPESAPIAPPDVGAPAAQPAAAASPPAVPNPATIGLATGSSGAGFSGAGSSGTAVPGGVTLAGAVDALAQAVSGRLKGVTRALYASATVASIDGDVVVIELANGPTRDRAERGRPEVEAALSSILRLPITLTLVAGEVGTSGSTPRAASRSRSSAPREPGVADPGPDAGGESDGDVELPGSHGSRAAVDQDEDAVDLSELVDASDVPATGADKLMSAFPGAEVVSERIES